jgi:hypothetical protein
MLSWRLKAKPQENAKSMFLRKTNDQDLKIRLPEGTLEASSDVRAWRSILIYIYACAD